MKSYENIKIENREILLCCGRGRCPSIKRDESGKENTFKISDDFGGSIVLDIDQLNAIKEALENINDI